MSSDAILVRKVGSGSSWTQPETAAYENESHLQELLAADPSRIPGVPPSSRAVREIHTAAGPLDICVVTPDGEITVVECKLEKNPEKRRMVIGQVIDYASAIRDAGTRAFEEAWNQRGGENFEEFLEGDALENLHTRLTSGHIGLCLAVDRIDNDLKRLVEYLNLITQDAVGVTALQLSYAKHENLEILIPTTFGTEIVQAKAATTGSSSGERWTWESFVESLSSPSDRELASELKKRLDAVIPTGKRHKLWFGRKPRGGIFFHIYGERFAPFQLWQNASQQLLIFGNWMSWPSLRNDERFAELAQILGQSHLEGSRSVVAAALDIEQFWQTAVRCDREINQTQ